MSWYNVPGVAHSAYRRHSIILYRPFGGGVRRVKVRKKEENVKNERPGFEGVEVGENNKPLHPKEVRRGMGVWGYDDQIIEVIKF